jgi:hypothetical protein
VFPVATIHFFVTPAHGLVKAIGRYLRQRIINKNCRATKSLHADSMSSSLNCMGLNAAMSLRRSVPNWIGFVGSRLYLSSSGRVPFFCKANILKVKHGYNKCHTTRTLKNRDKTSA